PVLGRVSMDLMAVDLTDLAETIQIGQLVELWGNYPEVDQLAQYNQTIGYELLCRLSARPERRIID
ncbi:alanine racemase C-terminal domain-containing protein, partial [Rhizobium hidalgonense]